MSVAIRPSRNTNSPESSSPVGRWGEDGGTSRKYTVYSDDLTHYFQPKRTESQTDRVRRYAELLTLSTEQMKKIYDAFLQEIQDGLELHRKRQIEWKRNTNGLINSTSWYPSPPSPPSLRPSNPSTTMLLLDSYVKKVPTGSETGVFYGVDVGGTNYRMIRIELLGKEVENKKTNNTQSPSNISFVESPFNPRSQFATSSTLRVPPFTRRLPTNTSRSSPIRNPKEVIDSTSTAVVFPPLNKSRVSQMRINLKQGGFAGYEHGMLDPKMSATVMFNQFAENLKCLMEIHGDIADTHASTPRYEGEGREKVYSREATVGPGEKRKLLRASNCCSQSCSMSSMSSITCSNSDSDNNTSTTICGRRGSTRAESGFLPSSNLREDSKPNDSSSSDTISTTTTTTTSSNMISTANGPSCSNSSNTTTGTTSITTTTPTDSSSRPLAPDSSPSSSTCCSCCFSPSCASVAARCIGVGLTFSFPCTQLSLRSSKLIHWAKGFATGRESGDPVEGRDIGELFQKAFISQSLPLEIKAVLNDTIGTLLACEYNKNDKDNYCYIGLIMGTGFNIAYIEPRYRYYEYQGKIINLECGNFDKFLPYVDVDIEIDWNSENKSEMRMEKLVAAAYIGEIVRLIILKVFQDRAPPTAWVENSLGVEDVMQIVNDVSPEHDVTEHKVLTKWGVVWEGEDLHDLYGVAKMVMQRSCCLSAMAICATAQQSGVLDRIRYLIENEKHASKSAEKQGREGENQGEEIVRNKTTVRSSTWASSSSTLLPPNGKLLVGLDGSLIVNNPWILRNMSLYISKLLGEEVARRIELVATEDGSGVGAALLAATADEQEKEDQETIYM